MDKEGIKMGRFENPKTPVSKSLAILNFGGILIGLMSTGISTSKGPETVW